MTGSEAKARASALSSGPWRIWKRWKNLFIFLENCSCTEQLICIDYAAIAFRSIGETFFSRKYHNGSYEHSFASSALLGALGKGPSSSVLNLQHHQRTQEGKHLRDDTGRERSGGAANSVFPVGNKLFLPPPPKLSPPPIPAIANTWNRANRAVSPSSTQTKGLLLLICRRFSFP